MAKRVARNWVPISEKRRRLVEAFVTISWKEKIKLNSNFKLTRTMWESALIGYAKLSRVRRILYLGALIVRERGLHESLFFLCVRWSTLINFGSEGRVGWGGGKGGNFSSVFQRRAPLPPLHN